MRRRSLSSWSRGFQRVSATTDRRQTTWATTFHAVIVLDSIPWACRRSAAVIADRRSRGNIDFRGANTCYGPGESDWDGRLRYVNQP
jgi:hypothetical protein